MDVEYMLANLQVAWVFSGPAVCSIDVSGTSVETSGVGFLVISKRVGASLCRSRYVAYCTYVKPTQFAKEEGMSLALDFRHFE